MGIIERVFSDADWRDDLDPELVNKLEKLLKRTKTYESAYKAADNPAMAQLWVAMAEVFHKLDRVDGRLRALERAQDAIIHGIEEAGIDDEELRETLDRY